MVLQCKECTRDISRDERHNVVKTQQLKRIIVVKRDKRDCKIDILKEKREVNRETLFEGHKSTGICEYQIKE